jgi:hypothetical protein
MNDVVYADRVNMNKPKLNSLALQCLVWIALAIAPVRVAAADIVSPAPAPDGSTPTPATADSSGDFVQLNLTPEALTTTNPVVKINMARWFSGSTIIKEEPNGEFQQILFANKSEAAPFDALMEDDATNPVPFPAGETRIVIDIGGTKTMQTFGFFSFTAQGTLDVYYSDSTDMITTMKTDPTEWKSANVHTEFNGKQVVALDLGAIDAHYVMAVFTMAQPGTISPLSMLGEVSTTVGKKAVAPNQESDDDEKQKNAKPVNPEDLVEFDYANAAYGTKVTDVLGGNINQAQNVLGANPKEDLTLGANPNPNAATPAITTPGSQIPAASTAPAQSSAPAKVNNIFIVDMGKDHDINKVGLLFKTEGSGKFNFYLLKQLPIKGKDQTPGAAPNAAATPTAQLYRSEPILLVANEGSLAEALILAQDAPAPDSGGGGDVKPVDYLPANFFTSTKPTFTQEVNGSNNDNKITQNYDNNLQFRFALIQWVPVDASQPPVQIYKVNLIGKVPIQDYVRASQTNQYLGAPSFAIAGPNPAPGHTADPGPTPTPKVNNPNPTPSQQFGGGNGGGNGGSNDTGVNNPSNPTVPPTVPQPVITP